MRKQEQLQENAEHSLSMARHILGRVKEEEFTLEQKNKLMEMVDNAVKLEKTGDKVSALKAYQQLKQYLEQIKPKDDVITYNGLKIKRFQTEFLKKTAEYMLREWMFLQPEKEYTETEIANKRKELESKSAKFVKKLDGEGNIIEFDCQNSQISELPPLPPNLEVLNCAHNLLETLPPLPESTVKLNCGYNHLENLPDLTPDLIALDCSGNELSKLPSLPPDLEILRCGQNTQLTKLLSSPEDKLPHDLKELNCWNCGLTELPSLSENLQQLNCAMNKLIELPTLPVKLDVLIADNNRFFSLPVWPENLRVLTLNKCSLTDLPPLPRKLQHLQADKNFFTADTIKVVKAHPNYNPTNFSFKNAEDFI